MESVEKCKIEYECKKYTERQGHGLVFEDKIVNKYNLDRCKNYTDIFDAYTKCNIPVQIKFIKHDNSIDMGDLYRKINIDTSFILVVGRWKSGKIIDSVNYHYIDISLFKKHTCSLDVNFLMKAKQEMKSISNHRDDDIKWRKFTKYYKPLLKSSILFPRFKRDHKSQKRIQCAIPNKIYKNVFCKLFPPYKCLEEILELIDI